MLVVVTGGSGSGKSAFAEETILSLGEARRIYIATMQLLTKKATGASADTGTCVQEKASRQ